MSSSVVFVIVAAIAIFVLIYRSANGENVYKYVSDKTAFIYDKFAPYSFKTIREKVKDLGQEYSTHQYMVQIIYHFLQEQITSFPYEHRRHQISR